MSVYERVHAVLSELPAIGKNSRAPGNMGGYAFRGIEDITAALKPLLAKHGVFMVPTVIERRDSERAVGQNKTMYVVDLLIRFTFYAAEPGPPNQLGEPTKFAADVWGEGTDMGDKATQKAVTAAFKSMLAVTFCISDAETDADAHDVPATVRHVAASPERVAEVRALVESEALAEWVHDQGFDWPWSPEACDAIEREARKATEVAPPAPASRPAAGEQRREDATAGGPPAAPSAPSPELKVGANTLASLQARVGALIADKVPVADTRIARGLPKLDEECSTDDAHGWAVLLDELEKEQAALKAPFTEQPELAP